MPLITPKSPDVLFAQAAAYATEHAGSEKRHEVIRRREDLFTLLGRVCAEGMDFAILGDDAYANAHLEPYVAYLREVKGMHGEAIKRRIELNAAFETFKPQFAEILEVHKHTPYNDLPKLPSFLGVGRSSKAYKIEADDKTYAVRISKMMVETDRHVSADLVGRGIPHMEQLVAVSYADRATVAEVVPGRSTAFLSEEQIKSITEEQLQTLFNTVVESFNKGVALDPVPGNFRYDSEVGFGIIDYDAQGSPVSQMRENTIVEAVRLSALALEGIGNRRHSELAPDFYAKESQLAASQNVLTMYRSIVKKSNLSSKDKLASLKEIDKCLEAYSPERLAASQAHYEHYYGPRKTK